MALKSYSCSLKSVGEAGTGKAVFATLNVVDKDGDLTIPGAFGEQLAKLVGAHDWSVPPIGTAKIYESGNQALANFQFNLAMPSAVEWYQSLKHSFEAGINTEWSYGFDILQYSYRDVGGKQVRVLEKMKVHEVSPVMVGAGVDTGTVSLKSCASCGSAHSDHGQTTEQQGERLLAEISDYIHRLKDIKQLRGGRGREKLISQANIVRCLKMKHEIQELLELDRTDSEQSQAREVFDQYQRTLARINVLNRR